MVTRVQRASDVLPEELRRVTDVTRHGTACGARAALRPMPLQAACCGAKAVVAPTRSLRTELAHDGVGVDPCQLHPPGVDTPQPLWARNRMDRARRIPATSYDLRAVARGTAVLAATGG